MEYVGLSWKICNSEYSTDHRFTLSQRMMNLKVGKFRLIMVQ